MAAPGRRGHPGGRPAGRAPGRRGRVRRMASRTPARSVTYGFAADADVRAEDVESLGGAGMRFVLVAESRRQEARVPTLGRHAVHNALAGAAVGLAAGMSFAQIVD